MLLASARLYLLRRLVTALHSNSNSKVASILNNCREILKYIYANAKVKHVHRGNGKKKRGDNNSNKNKEWGDTIRESPQHSDSPLPAKHRCCVGKEDWEDLCPERAKHVGPLGDSYEASPKMAWTGQQQKCQWKRTENKS
jgi:hypothetical protein